MDEGVLDVVIIGAGPAGIQAAIHAVRRKTEVLMLGRPENSSLHGAHIENYACIQGVSDGARMLTDGLAQVKGFGAQTSEEDVLKIQQVDNKFSLVLESGRTVLSRTVVFCMGVSKKKLKVAGEKELSGRGVSYCVDCDANFYRNATVCVVGNRSAAVDGALTLLGYASKVYLIADTLNVSQDLAERLRASEVEIIEGSVEEIQGQHAVSAVRLSDGRSLDVEGIFIELGSKGALELATQVGVALDMDTMQYIETSRKMATNIAGIYAAGDITGPPYQMAKAVGEGCIAGMEAAMFAKKVRQQDQAD
jgi:thioredoxin reductase (NADPH)